ncbi:ABC transporter ATP-binding protein, partial [Schumannella sp. 10F1B-5-1]
MTPEPSGAAARPLLVVEHLKKVYPTATGGVEAVRDLHFS